MKRKVVKTSLKEVSIKKSDNFILYLQDRIAKLDLTKWESKEEELSSLIKNYITYLKEMPEDEWEMTDSWMDLVETCVKYNLHIRKRFPSIKTLIKNFKKK